jgi:hypothetical protein
MKTAHIVIGGVALAAVGLLAWYANDQRTTGDALADLLVKARKQQARPAEVFNSMSILDAQRMDQEMLEAGRT